MLLFSVVIGIISTAGAICFRALIELFQELFWKAGETFTDRVSSSFLWLRVLVPSSLGLLAGLLMFYIIPEARGPGVSEVMFQLSGGIFIKS